MYQSVIITPGETRVVGGFPTEVDARYFLLVNHAEITLPDCYSSLPHADDMAWNDAMSAGFVDSDGWATFAYVQNLAR